MPDHNEKLIEEARGFAAGSDSARVTLLRDLADALEAAEKMHTPTDDEREAPKPELCDRCGWAISAHARSMYGLDCPMSSRPGFLRSPRPAPPVYLAADLWGALGAPSLDFDGYYERNGWANTWSNLLGVVRDRFKLKCGQGTEGEPCVLTAGHLPPHYGPTDVGSSEPVPVAEETEPSADWDRVHDRPADIYTPPEDRVVRPASEPQGEPSDARVLDDAEAMSDLLDEMNEAGVMPELPFRDAQDIAGVAYLVDEGDTTRAVFLSDPGEDRVQYDGHSEDDASYVGLFERSIDELHGPIAVLPAAGGVR